MKDKPQSVRALGRPTQSFVRFVSHARRYSSFNNTCKIDHCIPTWLEFVPRPRPRGQHSLITIEGVEKKQDGCCQGGCLGRAAVQDHLFNSAKPDTNTGWPDTRFSEQNRLELAGSKACPPHARAKGPAYWVIGIEDERFPRDGGRQYFLLPSILVNDAKNGQLQRAGALVYILPSVLAIAEMVAGKVVHVRTGS